jgi:spoIIIJ-associated protein
VNDQTDPGELAAAAETEVVDAEAAGDVEEAETAVEDGASAEAAADVADAADEADEIDDADETDDGPENPLETEAEIAADYLEELLDIADLDGDIDTFIEGDRAHVSIVSESEALVGPDGTVLDALQELTRLAVMTETGDRSRLMLDVAGYRERRRKELLALATDAVREVQDSRDRVPLAPMNPFERKIVHDAVAAAGLTSESEGEEPRRRVVVLPV